MKTLLISTTLPKVPCIK